MLEESHLAAATAARADFQVLLRDIRSFAGAILKPGFDELLAVFEALQHNDEPHLSQPELFELLARFDMMLPPVENALRMSLSLLQRDRCVLLKCSEVHE